MRNSRALLAAWAFLSACAVRPQHIDADLDASTPGVDGSSGRLVALGGTTTPGCEGCVRDECQVATCDGATCTRRDRADGAPCASGVCVAGECVSRGCGDGWVEPGPTPPAEGCDDGNTVSGDGCSSSCVPEVLTLAPNDALRAPTSVAVDGEGRALALWIQEDPANDVRELRAQRFTRAGGPDGASLVVAQLAGLGSDVELVSAGRAEGWAVAWSAAGGDRDGYGVRVAYVSASGVVASSFPASDADGDQRQPAIAARGAEVVVAFADQGVPMSHGGVGRMVVRRFDAAGVAIGTPEVVSTAEHPSGEPALVARGNELVLAWSEGPDPIEAEPAFESRVVFRRHAASTWGALEVLSAARASSPTLAVLDDGNVISSMLTRSPAASGNVRAVVIEPTSLGAVTDFSTGAREWAPVVAATAQGHWLAAWEQNERTPTLGITDATGWVDPADLDRLRGAWLGRSAAGVSMMRAPRGVWVVWTDAVVGGRAVRAHLLPYPDLCRRCGGEAPLCDAPTGTCYACDVDADCVGLVGASASCVARECVYTCEPDRADCDGDDSCETDLTTDASHCGACGFSCVGRTNTTGGVCNSGSCSLSCSPGFTSCDDSVVNGCETHVYSDAMNCGGCGTNCTDDPNVEGAACTTGSCAYSCNAGYADCTTASGCETNLQTDDYNCGACGNSCWGRPNTWKGICNAGSCSFSCDIWYDDCDGVAANGCEIFYATDVQNCGACHNSCLGRPNSTGASCSAGQCNFACTGSYRHCDGSIANGCETNVATSATNCGACGVTCLNRPNTTGGTCSSGTCNLACISTHRNCDGQSMNGCETPIGTLANCLSCGNQCDWDCEATGCNDATSITTGETHSCAIRESGGLVCWGYNWYGRLGDGTMTTRATPVPVTSLSSGVTSVSAGGHHTCAVQGGVAWCWGFNGYGQLGDGTTTNRTTPVAVSGFTTKIKPVAIAAGAYHSCALLSTGGVRCWGYNAYGQLGDGTTTNRTTPVNVPGIVDLLAGRKAVAVAVGDYHSCALLNNGTVRCWGSNSHGQRGTKLDTSLPLIGAITAGGTHTCARAGATSGALYCWGGNSYGQLGDGTTANRTQPIQVSGLGSGVSSVSAGTHHTCATLTSGVVRCWGYNGYGAIGDGTYTDRLTPVTLWSLSGGRVISGGGYHTCIVLAGGGVRCWGRNNSSQIGDGTTTTRNTPQSVTAP